MVVFYIFSLGFILISLYLFSLRFDPMQKEKDEINKGKSKEKTIALFDKANNALSEKEKEIAIETMRKIVSNELKRNRLSETVISHVSFLSKFENKDAFIYAQCKTRCFEEHYHKLFCDPRITHYDRFYLKLHPTFMSSFLA
ncbi:MAG: hypothetical protein CL760_09525 [Chloroflexi bacterium]|nr:hypothetical protein [Chloroflexota bacterium]|tara:strand:- start:9010 stop:9435 length:426 start_codon:yes stop_codon:yes gene_type:complete